MKYEMDVIDESSRKRRLWIEDGKVRYTDLTTEHSGMYMLNTDQFDITPGKVTLDYAISEAFATGTGSSYVKRLLLFGFTSFIQVIDINHEISFHATLNKSRDSLITCPLDYVHAVRLPLFRLTDSWIRKMKLESIPIIFLKVGSVQELISTPWRRVMESMFPKRILLVCEPSGDLTRSEREGITNTWEQIVKDNRMNSFFNFPPAGMKISPLLAKRIGLFPKKGALIMGSDADYLMYGCFTREEQPIKVPDAIVLKGNVVKAGNKWSISTIRGEELTGIVPEQFLPIQDVYRYED